jgi:hypothetical protein
MSVLFDVTDITQLFRVPAGHRHERTVRESPARGRGGHWADQDFIRLDDHLAAVGAVIIRRKLGR